MRATKVLIIIIVATETTLLLFAYGDYIFGGMLGLGLIWLILDLTLIYKTKRYTLEQMQAVCCNGRRWMGVFPHQVRDRHLTVDGN